MAFAFDFEEGTVLEWYKEGDGARCERVPGYTPSLFVRPAGGQLAPLQQDLAVDPKVADTGIEERFLSLEADERTPVLRVDCERIADVSELARELKHTHERERAAPGAYRLFNVDLAPQFRYAVDTGTKPVPSEPLSTLRIDIPEKALAEGRVSAVEVDSEGVGSDPATVLQAIDRRVETVDPDVLMLSTGELVPFFFEEARRQGLSIQLGRRPGYTQLAGENTFESYGRVGHSPARYNVPGRVILDRSNSFLWGRSSLPGLLDLVERSWKPLQEVGWASIGNVLTAIQIRAARTRDVLIPWNKWRPEAFKDIHTLHAADRGGFIFQPDVGLHEDVYEVDFASLYPRIICEHNISPETIRCDCHADRADVPELDYSICDAPGFLPDVLQPLLDAREDWKAELARIEEIEHRPVGERTDAAETHLTECDALSPASALAGEGTSPADGTETTEAGDPLAALDARKQILESKSSAIKWILVSCFGYQGYRNSKFGRIECHEAINAVARDVLLTAKERAEANGWRVVHGIVDSLWITPADADATEATTTAVTVSTDTGSDGTGAADPASVETVTTAISEEIDIALEIESRYDWVAFVPKRKSDTGALTRYFGKVAGADAYKVRGIEARQRSTPAFVESVQRDLLSVLDRERDPEAVCERLREAIARLQAGRVDPAELVITKRVSQSLAEYSQETHTVAALRRATAHDLECNPGQDVHFVVVEDNARGRERVRLGFEDVPAYDADFYSTLLVRACESVVSPLGWDRTDVRRYLAGGENYELSAFS